MVNERDAQADKPELSREQVYQIRIDLKGIRPPIWRRLLVPARISLSYLHSIIQVAMGWVDAHLHDFEHEGVEIRDMELFDDELYAAQNDVLDETVVTLDTFLWKVGDKLTYTYDFGDNWVHVVKLEKVLPYNPDEVYPVCVAGRRASPPEDVGGIGGYLNFLMALADETHPEHEDYVAWIGGEFDPEVFDPEVVNEELQDLREPTPSPLHPLTVIRWEMLSPEVTHILMDGVPGMMAEPGPGSEKKSRRLRKAKSVRALLELIPFDDTLLLGEWMRYLESYGAAAAVPIAEYMVEMGASSADEHAWVQERLSVVLFRLGAPAIPALYEVFDALDPFGKALACVVLGQLGASGSADLIWGHFVEAIENAPLSYFVGPMWGLIDLNDPRAADAVVRVLADQWEFTELPAMVGKAGDRRAVAPLMLWMMEDESAPGSPLIHALTLLGHRVGRRAIIEEIERSSSPQEEGEVSGVSAETVADLILSYSVEEARAAFRMMFETLTLDDLAAAIGDWDDEDDELYIEEDDEAFLEDMWPTEEPTVSPLRLPPARGTLFQPQSHAKPGRNDPCWCGSGKRYKDCHWRSDFQRDIPEAA